MVVSDLNGDGDNEVISITKDYVLQVISPEMFADASNGVYSPEVKKSVRLSRFNIQKVRVILVDIFCSISAHLQNITLWCCETVISLFCC